VRAVSGANQTILDAIIALAEEIGRTSPEAASKAMQIVDLVRSIEAEPDQNTIQDVLDAEVGQDQLSDVSSRRTAAAVVRAINDDEG
jgi:hypothetical protein